MEGERDVGGLSCSQVLAGLPAYLDGTLPAEMRPAVEAHVRGCDRCERFGGAYARVAERIRHLTADTQIAPDVLERLRERLSRAIGE